MVYVETAARMIAEVAEDDKIVVEKSTVPCKTAEDIRKILAAIGKPGVQFDILSNPEFLAEGTAINDLLHPDRVLIGSLKTTRGLQAAAALAGVYGRWVPYEHIITINLWSSEMAKLSANALLAQRISSINALSAVCEATGADIDEVSNACGLDNRIGSRMLKSSIGFGGSCFKKDVLSLVYIAETHNLPEVAAYWKGVVDINEYQKDRFIKRIVKCLFSTLTNKKVAILGYAYKKDTGDTRQSAAISIVTHLTRENAEVTIFDPKVKEEQVWLSLVESNDEKTFDLIQNRVSICQTPYQACENADAVVIATEWDEFSNKTATKAPPCPNPALQPPNSFQIPPKKKRASLIIRNPHTGDVVNFERPSWSSMTPDRSQNAFNEESVTMQQLYEGSDRDVPTTGESSRASIIGTSRASSITSPTLVSPLTEISRDPNRSLSVTESAVMAASDDLETYIPSTLGTYWLGKVKHSDTANHTTSADYTGGQFDTIRASKKVVDETRKLDWSRVARVMRRPMFVFDGRNVIDAEKLSRLGFWVEGIGKASVAPQS